MVKQTSGFTMLELILVLCLITTVSLISMTRWQYLAKANENIDVITTQIQAMLQQESVFLNQSLYFNGNGNINHAQTIEYKHKTCVFQLGFGRFYCE